MENYTDSCMNAFSEFTGAIWTIISHDWIWLSIGFAIPMSVYIFCRIISAKSICEPLVHNTLAILLVAFILAVAIMCICIAWLILCISWQLNVALLIIATTIGTFIALAVIVHIWKVRHQNADNNIQILTADGTIEPQEMKAVV